MRQAYDYWQDQPGLYITTITTHRHSRGCDSRSTKTFPKAREACRAQGDRQASMQRKLTSERLQGEEAATMLFPSQRKAVRVQSSEMHKLALIDNCTQVLLPTQASSSALASTQQPCNSHASQPQTKARGPHVGRKTRRSQGNLSNQ